MKRIGDCTIYGMGIIVLFASLLLVLPRTGHTSGCWSCEVNADGTEDCTFCGNKEGVSESPTAAMTPKSPMDRLYDEGLRFLYGGDFADENEGAAELRVYMNESRNVNKVIKERTLSVQADTGGTSIRDWLEGSVKRLLSARAKHPQSRHLSEMLGWTYRELYYETGSASYLHKAADAFLLAENLGFKYHGPISHDGHYYSEIARLLSELKDVNRLVAYFTMMMNAFPDNQRIPFFYAEALAKLGDERTDAIYKKAIAMRENYNAILGYAEYLLDKQRNKEALDTLGQLSQAKQRYPYPHLLKGVALERLGDTESAKKEYDLYLKDIRKPGYDPSTYSGSYMAPKKYKIPGSKIQGDIPFERRLQHHPGWARALP